MNHIQVMQAKVISHLIIH